MLTLTRALLVACAAIYLGVALIACSGGDDAPGPTSTPEHVTAAMLCASASAVPQPAAIASPDLIEISGLAASAANGPGAQDVIWAHNDSGDSARVFAIAPDGGTLAVYTLEGAEAFDWEDMAIGAGPEEGADYLYMGDIGDNAAARAQITVYRVPEPRIDPASSNLALSGVEALTLTYPDGAHDAETLLIDPPTGDLYIVTKDVTGGPSGVYRAPAPLDASAPIVLERAGAIDWAALAVTAAIPADTPPLPRALPKVPTGGDISADGSVIAIRTYGAIWLWQRAEDRTIAQALANAPCEAPSAVEPQGEAIAIARDGRGYITASEGVNPPINRFTLD